MKHLRNLVLGIHHNGLEVSYLATTTPYAYPITMPLVAPLVIFAFLLDPKEFDRR